MLCFIDTEFSDFINTELISIGAVTEDGKEFYAEVTDYDAKMNSKFVNQHIVPLLGQSIPGAIYDKKSVVAARFGEWLENLGDQIQLGIDYSTDWDLAVDLLEDVWPKNLDGPPVNIYGDMQLRCVKKLSTQEEPLVSIQDAIKWSKKVFEIEFMKHFLARKCVPQYLQHHSLFDARANREGWMAALRYIDNL